MRLKKQINLLVIAIAALGYMSHVNAESTPPSAFNSQLPIPAKFTIAQDNPRNAKVILASQNYAAFWNTGDEKYAYAALAKDFKYLNLPEGRHSRGVKSL